ncbi:MAG: NADH-quinone oxidoreductase subunit N [Anaerolineales bacterium]
MSGSGFELSMFLPVLPEALLLLLAGVILAVDLIWKPEEHRFLGWLTAGGFGIVLVFTLIFTQPGSEGELVLGGMIRHDWLAYTFKALFLFVAAITSLLSMGLRDVAYRGEYFAMLVVTTLGMNLMASAADLLMVFLAIETTSIPLYVLAGFMKRDRKSTESGMKYFLFGALTSGVMLYGFSLLYGFTGESNLYALDEALRGFTRSSGQIWMIIVPAILMLVGFAFKVSAAPFHFWSPDVYEGAPTPITAFISTASKAAGFAVLLRVFLVVFPWIEAEWTAIVAAMAAVTMTVGNLLAISQTNIKRLLAYSSIAHAGYALIGLVAADGTASVIFYLVAYVVTNLAAFAVIILFSHYTGSDEISDYAGLSRRSPGLALVLLVAFLSLAGMPPLAGFVAKFYIFAAAVRAGWIWLAVLGVLNAIIGLYYYLTILKVIYLYRSEDDDVAIPSTTAFNIAMVVCVAAILVIGVFSGPLLDWSLSSAMSLF